LLVVFRMDPSHHTKSTNIVEVDGLEPEEAEVGEVDPVAAILVTSQVVLSNAGYILFRDSFGLADEGRPAAPNASPSIPACPTKRLHRGSAFRFWVCTAILLMRKMGRPEVSNAKGISDPKRKPRMLAR
jgi:hypothetical protein